MFTPVSRLYTAYHACLLPKAAPSGLRINCANDLEANEHVPGLDGLSMRLMRRWWSDTLFTAGMVALAAVLPLLIGRNAVDHVPLLFSLLVVVIAAARGGLVQGLLATTLCLALQVGLWGDITWLLPRGEWHHFLESVVFVVEGVTISLMVHFNLLGHLSPERSSHFQTLFETFPVGLVVHDGTTIQAINSVGAKLFGYRRQELIGRAPQRILTQDSLNAVIQHARLGHREAFVGAGLRKDGQTFEVEFSGNTIVFQKQAMQLTAIRESNRLLGDSHRASHHDPHHLTSTPALLTQDLEQRIVEQGVELAATSADLRMAREQIQVLRTLLPVCARCGKLRTDEEYRARLTAYLYENEGDLLDEPSHNGVQADTLLCPACAGLRQIESLDAMRPELHDVKSHRQSVYW